MLLTADSSSLRNGSTTCQSRAHGSPVWQLCENTLRKGQKMPKGRKQRREGKTEGTMREQEDKERSSMTKQAHPFRDCGP